jgi:hypothetical protein
MTTPTKSIGPLCPEWCRPAGGITFETTAPLRWENGRLTALTLTAGCAMDLHHLRSDCDWAEPIRSSRNDVLTDGTLVQIIAYNEIGELLCNWRL